MSLTEQNIQDFIKSSQSRIELWIKFINAAHIEQMAEVGVYRGEFAWKLLEACQGLKKYYMIDPWRHLENWNKPANTDDRLFEEYLAETKARTDFAASRRVILRGKTTEVVDEISDGELDFAYIDGDHTLKGITIDLIRIFPKIKIGGWIGGDDFSTTIWQHDARYEPSLIFPLAVFFAEAVGEKIIALPMNQFLLEKSGQRSFAFLDLTGKYRNTDLRNQFRLMKAEKTSLLKNFPAIGNMIDRIKNYFRSGE